MNQLNTEPEHYRRTFKELISRLKKRSGLALAFVLLPMPFLLNLAIHGGSKFGMPEANVSGDQTAVILMYGSMALMLSALFAQVIYTGRVLTEAVPQNKHQEKQLSIAHLLVFYFPGNFVISLILELFSYIPMFLPDFLAEKAGLGTAGACLIKIALAALMFLFALEIWFRYFRRHGQRFQNRTLFRFEIWKKYKPLFIGLGAALCLVSLLPDKGAALIPAMIVDAAASLLVWEVFGSGLCALNDT